MNPLDLLKVKFQISTCGPEASILRSIGCALCDMHASEGWRGLYHGLGPNVASSTRQLGGDLKPTTPIFVVSSGNTV